MSEIEGQQTTDTCPHCPTRLECACPDGRERCPDNDDCPCDKTVCPCGKHARRPPEEPPPSDPAPPPHTPLSDEPPQDPPPWRRPGVIGLLALVLLAIAIAVALLSGGGGGDDPDEVAITDEVEEPDEAEPSADADGEVEVEGDTDAEETTDEPDADDEADEPPVEFEELASTFDGDPVLADLGLTESPFMEHDCGRRAGVVHQTGGSPLEGISEFGVVCTSHVDVPGDASVPAGRWLLVVGELPEFQPPAGTMAPLQLGIGLDVREGGPPAATEGEGLVRIEGVDVLAFGRGESGWTEMQALNNGDFTQATMAGFSSRGPSTFGIAVRPDVGAPAVDGVGVQAFWRATPDGQDPAVGDPAASRALLLGPVCDGCAPVESGRFMIELVGADVGTSDDRVLGDEVLPGFFVFPAVTGGPRVAVHDVCETAGSVIVNVAGSGVEDVEVEITDTATSQTQVLTPSTSAFFAQPDFSGGVFVACGD